MRLVYGPYEPDKPPFLASGLQGAENVYRSAIGYRPVGHLVTVTDALPALPKGAASFVSSTGTNVVLAGTQTRIYRQSGTAWVQLTGTYNTVLRWRFAQFGGIAVATNGSDAPQKIDLTTFAVTDLGGSPPTMKNIAVVKDFLVGGVINGVANMVRWSALNNAEGWTIGLNQSDYQILPTGGEVTGLIGGEFGLVLQRSRVTRMTYVGDNLVFQFDEISNSIGCSTTHSVIQAGQLGFWLSDSGFIMWDAATLKPIGQEVIDRTFAASYSNADFETMSTAVDVKNNLVAWAMHDRMFVYNWILNSWTVINQSCPIIFSGFSASTDPLFYAFSSDYKLGTFSGSPMRAAFGLGDLEMIPGREARIISVRPLSDAVDGVSLTFVCRQRQGDQADEHIYDALEDNGEMPVRESGRYIRLTHTIEADTNWTYCEGLDVTIASGARR